MKKIDELKVEFNAKREEAERLLNSGDVAGANAKLEEAKRAKAAVDAQAALDAMDYMNIENVKAKATNKEEKAVEKIDAFKAFADAARHNFRNATSMTEGTKENGGYTVPEDIDTQIRTLRESADSLDRLVTVETVTTLSGARTYKTRSQQTGMTKVNEGGTITAGTTPTFTRVTYTVEKYADLFYATNELLEDTDANITGTLVDWIAGASRVGRNKLILDTLKAGIFSETDLVDLDGFKKAINVTLDPAFRPYIKIITNQDGLQYLDTLTDNDGNYILQPMVQDPTRYRAFGFEVVVLSNATMPSASSAGTNVPFLIGDLASAIHLFVRKGLSIVASDTAADAFERDMTIWRAIERLDCVLIDDKAIVRGKINIPGE